MYAEAELLFPYLQGLGLGSGLDANHHCSSNGSGGHHHLQLQEEELLLGFGDDNGSFLDDYYACDTQPHLNIIPPSENNNPAPSSVSEYDLGDDLFNPPEPIMEETILSLDPMTMMSCCEDFIPMEPVRAGAMEGIETQHLFSDVFFADKKDFLERSAMEESFPELADVKFPTLQNGDDHKENMVSEAQLQKSVSYGCLTTKNWVGEGGAADRPNFFGFHGMDFGAAFGLRRAYSEGDIKTLGNGGGTCPVDAAALHQPYERLFNIDDYKLEERREKLSRYRKKKTKRNFGRKIKYACRKALADSQPRVRGRFAKTEESGGAKRPK